MGISERFSIAFAKSQLAAGVVLPTEGTIFISLNEQTKRNAVRLCKPLAEMGYRLMATDGTARRLQEAGIDVTIIKKLQEGHPNLLDYLIDGAIKLIVNTPSGKGARTDEGRIRAAAVSHGVPCITTIPAADAAVRAMAALREESMTVMSLQEIHPSLAPAPVTSRA